MNVLDMFGRVELFINYNLNNTINQHSLLNLLKLLTPSVLNKINFSCPQYSLDFSLKFKFSIFKVKN
jgi:hypothetical protein